MNGLIEAHNLSKSFGELHAVRGVNLEVNAGEIFGLVGPDGAGKTTTIRLLCGAYLPDGLGSREEPTILLGSYDMIRDPETARSQLGYLPQRFSMYEELTVLENIRFFAETRGQAASDWLERCMEILDFVDLGDYTHRRAGHLSGGMKQKLGLAAALVHDPSVLLLDEPTTGVDPVTRQDFWKLIIRLVSRVGNQEVGRAVFVSTPYMDEAARCTRIGLMLNGRLVEQGAPSQLPLRLAGRIIELSGSPLPLLRKIAKECHFVEDVQVFGDRLHLRVGAGEAGKTISLLEKQIKTQGGKIRSLSEISPQLEDIFMEFSQDSE
jgi:ABC-2 type transport system ATP-binding protein